LHDPDEPFDHEAFVERELHGREPRRPYAWLWIMVAVILVIVVLLVLA
jgi:hypothetical protein